MKILLVDDNGLFLKNITTICELRHLEVVCFQDPLMALSYITANGKELSAVFTDLDMRQYGVSGNIIAQKCIEANVPVYFLTGMDPQKAPTTCRAISKLDVDGLLSTLDSILIGA